MLFAAFRTVFFRKAIKELVQNRLQKIEEPSKPPNWRFATNTFANPFRYANVPKPSVTLSSRLCVRRGEEEQTADSAVSFFKRGRLLFV